MKNRFRTLLTCLSAFCLLHAGSLTAAAYSPEDVAAKARNAGWPEYLVQAGLNEWSTGGYTQEQLDQAYASVEEYTEKSGQMIANSFGLDFIPSAPASENPAPSSSAAAETSVPDETASPDAASSDEANPTEAAAPPAATEPLVVTKSDGTTEERISKADFIQMPIEEKKAYVASLAEESKTEFMGSLSVEERNSILKQLPAEEKAELIQNYIDAAKDMGMNVAVDEIGDNNVSMTVRNNDGQIIGKTAVGMIIDETGISHIGELLTVLGMAFVSVLGFAMLYRYISRTE